MASTKVLEAKKQVVADLSERMKNAKSGVLVDYKGITVEDDTKLRKNLREAGVSYEVIKNTLISKACDVVGYEGLKGVLEGMTALALCDKDEVTAAKIINEYASKSETYKIKAGFVDGEVMDENGVKALAAIPSKEVLIGRLMGSMRSSLYGLAFALQAIIDKKNEEAAS